MTSGSGIKNDNGINEDIKAFSSDISYSQCMTRLRELVGKLEGSQVDVDALEQVVEESVKLVTTCRERLRATQSSVDTLLAGLTDSPSERQTRTLSPPDVPGVPYSRPRVNDNILTDPFAE